MNFSKHRSILNLTCPTIPENTSRPPRIRCSYSKVHGLQASEIEVASLEVVCTTRHVDCRRQFFIPRPAPKVRTHAFVSSVVSPPSSKKSCTSRALSPLASRIARVPEMEVMFVRSCSINQLGDKLPGLVVLHAGGLRANC